MKRKNIKYILLFGLMYSCTPSDNSAYDKGYDTGFNAGYEDGLKKAEEQNQQALEEAIELGYQEGKEKYLKEKREIEARKSESEDGGKWNIPKDDEEYEDGDDEEYEDGALFGQITVEIEPIQLMA
jgi:hypothetical protein